MTRSSIKAGLAVCLVFGVADLVAINVWVLPELFPPPPEGGTTSAGVAGSKSITKGASSTVGDRTVQPSPKVAVATRSKAVPAKPEPAKPEPAKPEPAKPEPAKPEPAKPEPVKPEPARPEPAKPEPARPEPTPTVLVEQRLVMRFATGVHQPDAPSIRQLAAFARRVRSTGQISALWIDGHADMRGGEVQNAQLSRRRARRVMQLLAERGVSPRRKTIRGHGSRKPEAMGNSAEAWARNRRVEIRVQIKKSGT